MRARFLLVAAAVAVALVIPVVPATANERDRVRHELGLDDPGLAGDPRVERLVQLRIQMDDLLERTAALEREIGRAAIAYIRAARTAETADAAVREAHDRLDDRIRTAYELGPGAAVEALLSAETFGDLGVISEYTSRTVSLDERALHEVTQSQVVAVSLRARAEADLAAMRPRLDELRAALAALDAQLEEATRLAEEARVQDAWFDQQRLALADAHARAESWEDLKTLTWGEDQAPYLALLGPTGGQTCDTPEGLVATGERFSGYASWYGWEFGGQPTAMGAIFDPTLFTAANRWLPMGSYLRVHYGDRCAIVLVNDRGPYGNLDRVIDLSMAAAHYLGVGVSWVAAEVLVVATPG
jgi:hypothetical protein